MKKILLALFLSLPAFASSPDYVEGEVIVKYKDGSERGLGAMMNSYQKLAVVNVQRFGGEFKKFEHLVFDQQKIRLEEVLAGLERDPSVEYAQPNFLLYALGAAKSSRPAIKPAPAPVSPTPDPSLSKAWGLAKIGASAAWQKQKGSKKVLVAVIDTGIDYNHPDLAANMWRNPNAKKFEQTGVDASGSSVTGDVVGWNFVHNDNLPFDDSDHGTHVAGTIGAVGENGKGVSGVSPRVSLLAVKFLSGSGSGATSDAIKSIDYSISRGAKILNNSWGGSGGPNRALSDAITRSEKAGVLFVAAAGNNGSDNETEPFYPAAFTQANVLTVASTTREDKLSSFSNYGAKGVHLAAPGSDIYSTVPDSDYSYLSGTSMAAPHVAGAAALVWAKNPKWNYRQVRDHLLKTGDTLAALRGKVSSGRRLNVRRAITGR